MKKLYTSTSSTISRIKTFAVHNNSRIETTASDSIIVQGIKGFTPAESSVERLIFRVEVTAHARVTGRETTLGSELFTALTLWRLVACGLAHLSWYLSATLVWYISAFTPGKIFNLILYLILFDFVK